MTMAWSKYDECYVSAGFNDAVRNINIPFRTVASIASSSTIHTAWPGASTSIVGTSTYTYSTTADITHVMSTSASDTDYIYVDGLGADGTRLLQVIPMTGQTPAALPFPMLAINEFRYLGTATNAGILYVTVGSANTSGSPTSGANVRGIVQVGKMQSAQAVFTTPSNCNLSLGHGYAQLHEITGVATTADVTWGGGAYREFDGAWTAFLDFGDVEISNDHFRHDQKYEYPLTLPGLSRVEVRVGPINAVSTTIRGLLSMRTVQK